jgi:transketolase
MPLDTKILSQAATDARGLAMDAVQASASGHLGLPLGCAEIGAVLFGHALSYFPEDPHWINRDRFVLSAGHGSMFLYSWLHLAGYDLSIGEIKNFRQLHSKTPGHPEFGETPGVEATTGPLGQGVGNAVGMAVAAKMAEARFNTKEHSIFDHKIVCLAGDGCLQEGVASEAAAFAGHQKLDNLILIYDSNDVTLDAMAKMSQSEDTAERFRAYGYDVHTVNGQDLEGFFATFEAAKYGTTGKPQFIVARTLIGKGIPEVAGTQKAHGEGGAKYVDADRKAQRRSMNILPATGRFLSNGILIGRKNTALGRMRILIWRLYWTAEFIARSRQTCSRGFRLFPKIARLQLARQGATFCSRLRRPCPW